MINVRNISLSFGSQTVFDAISCIIQEHDRIGLFGQNGSGKSTLLKVLAGKQLLDKGTVTVAKGKTVAYLPQEVVLASERSIIDETMSTFDDLLQAQNRLQLIEQRLKDTPQDLMLLDEYAQLCQTIALYEPDQKRAKAAQMLQGLGFSISQFATRVNTLSVGWRMRIVLAKLLLQNADMYLFDEPTNHLDIVAKEWFLEFLAQSNVGFVLVCHEKRFLNRVCTTIMELEHGVATQYVGNYDRYVQQKQASLERLETAYENQQRMLKQMQATIDRFRASASKARMAQSMIKKMNAIERITIPPTSKKITIAVPSPAPSGRIVLTVQDVGYCFGDKKIFEHATFTLERGNKAAIVAANGVGKTTLLNIVTGLLPLQTGSVTMGHAVTTAIFDQDQALSLDLDRTVFENASIDTQHASEQTIRALLGSFLFDHNAINKKTRVLSGGERNRLGMVRILLRNANFLLLDEPTNHLDIPSKEMLLHALQSYTGTILFVSHDYDFVNELATHIIELTVDGTALYHGNYDAYIHQKKLTNDDLATRPLPHIMSEKKVISKKPQSQEAQKEVRLLERSIERLEAEIQRVEHSFGALAYGSEDFNKATRTLKMLRVEYEQMMREWEMHVS